MRFIIARVNHETNTFSPLKTSLSSFNPKWDNEAYAAAKETNTAMKAFIEFAETMNAEIVTPVFALANPSGPVEDHAFEALLKPISDAVLQGCDAILLDLHGAMVTYSHADGEGEMLRRLRKLAPNTPIGVALDLHANVTELMVECADVIVGFKTYPHIDMHETGAHVARIISNMMKVGTKPKMALCHPPILAQTLKMNTSQPGVMHDLVKAAYQAEQENNIQAVSIFGGFPIADTAETGLSVVVVAETEKCAYQSVTRFANIAWERRHELVYEQIPLPQSITAALKTSKEPGKGPVLLLDHGDNCMSGGTCDVMDVISEAEAQGLTGVVAGPIADKEAVETMHKAGINKRAILKVGNRFSSEMIGTKNDPLVLSGIVIYIGDGDYVITGPTYTGMKCSMGRIAVLDTGWAQILISELPQEPWDKGIFDCAHINTEAANFLILKSRMYCRPIFEPIARAVVECASSGVTSSELELFQYKYLSRPIFPLDPKVEFDANNTVRLTPIE